MPHNILVPDPKANTYKQYGTYDGKNMASTQNNGFKSFLPLLWKTFIILQTVILCCLPIFFNYFFNISIAITSLFPQIRNQNPPFHCTSKSFFPHSRRKLSLREEISPVKQDSALKCTGCRIVDNQIFNPTTDRDSTTFLCNLFQSLATLIIKTTFPVVQMACPKLKFVPLGSCLISSQCEEEFGFLFILLPSDIFTHF